MVRCDEASIALRFSEPNLILDNHRRQYASPDRQNSREEEEMSRLLLLYWDSQ